MSAHQKTALIWNTFEEVRLSVVNGDWSELNGVYINLYNEGTEEDIRQTEEKQDKLSSLVYDEEYQEKIEFCGTEEFAQAVRDGAVVVICGFIP